ncbi:NAD(P)-binding protein [Hypoxylon trugodes]|uniref:NAD(P)-binding protein n=1 Tax=Hypoxylon trugodes TaxID=326681 RepID=UPI00219933E1|nr:NAD(P)-binding protein [Hypoxylon trugodes]KAI1390846.1 NAD(P)-binding protein [Hypoxylon trugodes]
MSEKGTVLITGLTGFLAGRVAEAALKTGYNVRGTVRDLEAGAEIRKALLELGYKGDVELAKVPDMTEDGAFDEAVIGCTAILHLAAPVRDTWTLEPPEVLRRGVNSTTGLLDSALNKAGPQLQSVVLMGSAAAIFDVPPKPGVYSEKNWNTTSEAAVAELGKDAGGLQAYCASKTAGERAFWKFREEKKPAFSMTAVQATYFNGPPLAPWKSKDQIPFSLGTFWKVLQGGEIPGSSLMYEGTVDVRDTARVVVWSILNPKEADGERFLCAAATGGAQAIADIVNKHIPSLGVAKGNPGQGYDPGYPSTSGNIAFDGSKARAATEQDWIPFETSVLDTAKFLARYLK